MSISTLSRRAILAGAASVPTLALPVVAAVALAEPAIALPAVPAVSVVNSDVEQLIALGDQLKPLFVEWLELRPKVHRAYDEALEAAGFTGFNRTDEQQAEAERRWPQARKQTGYDRLYKQLCVLDRKTNKLTRAILKIKAADRRGDGIRAAAIIVRSDDSDNSPEVLNLLWGMAVMAGFPTPSNRMRAVRAQS